MKNILIFILLLMGNYAFCQFPSTESYKLCSEIPKAEKIGDTVYVYTCMKSGDRFVFQGIDRKGRYKYKGLPGGKSFEWITYDSLDRVQSNTYKYSGYGGNGKGFFLIHYYENGNIKNTLFDDMTFNSVVKVIIYDSLDYKEPILSKIPFKRYFLHKKGKRYYIFDEYELERKIIRKTIRKFHFEKVKLIEDFPYCVYARSEATFGRVPD